MSTFNPRKFTKPDTLRTIDQQRLAVFLSPWRDYLHGRGVALPDGSGTFDHEGLARILMTPDGHLPTDMVDALYYVHETASHEDMDALLDIAEKRNIPIEHDPKTSVTDVAMQMWLVAPDVLRERHAEAVAFRQQNFLYYGGKTATVRRFPRVDEDLTRRIELSLDDWFEKRRRGRDCRVFFFYDNNKVWILVRHGLPHRREASQRDDGTSSIAFYRPQQHDVLIYDPRYGDLGVHAQTKGEIKLYLSTFGAHLFGDANHFPPGDKFTLAPLVTDGSASLVCGDVDGIEGIRLVEYRRYWGGSYQEQEIRKASDIFASLLSRGQSLKPGGSFVAAAFRVKFADSPKERLVTVRPPGNAKYERNEDSEIVERWLTRRGFMLRPEVANDVEETGTTALEGAA